MKWKYRGEKYVCPLCGKRYARFIPGGFDYPVLKELDVVGAGFRENARCPNCDANDRQRLIFLFLSQNGFLKKSLDVLHVAPEKQLQKVLKRINQKKYVSIDLDSTLAEYRMDIQRLNFQDESFDLIICSHVLEHVVNDRLAMREIRRVLRPGGTAILQVPISWKLSAIDEEPTLLDEKERVRRFGQIDHIRMYNEGGYLERLNESGFSVRVLPPTEIVDENLIQLYALNPRESLYICSR